MQLKYNQAKDITLIWKLWLYNSQSLIPYNT